MHQATEGSIRRAGGGSGGTWWRAFSVATLLGGLWLAASRAAIETSAGTAVVWNGIAAGIAIAVVSAIRLANWHVHPRLSLANVALGGWLIMSPPLYGYALWVGSHLAWNDLLTGIMITACALASFAVDADDR